MNATVSMPELGNAAPLAGYELAAQISMNIELVKASDIEPNARRAKLRKLNKALKDAIAVGDALKAEADAIAPIIVMMNGTPVDINVAGTTFTELLAVVAEHVKKEHGKWIRLAAKMNAEMAFDWFDIDHQEQSANKKLLWSTYYTPAKAAVGKDTNFSVAWTRLRNYGKNLRAGLSPDGKRKADGTPLAGEGQDTSTGGAKGNEARTPLVRNSDELSALYAANVRFKFVEGTDDALILCQSYIVKALAAIGVDARTIKVDKSK